MSEHLFDMKETRKSIHYINADNKEWVATFIECVWKADVLLTSMVAPAQGGDGKSLVSGDQDSLELPEGHGRE